MKCSLILYLFATKKTQYDTKVAFKGICDETSRNHWAYIILLRGHLKIIIIIINTKKWYSMCAA